ncbi:carbohydrate-binding protein [uncultured Aquimarina sp.]|uniref:carbohydrate-binding protein n=1 Tax=uncultured Aquimarina sp. TaxID=575652 RepID=UPI002620A67E|nr:carbohydrate-binding protein [uncultured Aquimarina sp.]
MKLLKPYFLIAFVFFGFISKAQVLEGEPRRWHKLSLTFNGPNTTETSNPNPFSDYRLEVTFIHRDSNRRYIIPGYFAACGDAEDTSCDTGNKWRVHFTPDDIGAWNWSASFTSGSNVAINGGGSAAGFMNGETGSFTVIESNKSGKDFRNKNLGRLTYVGEHYLKHTGTNPENPNGPWFLKAGADSPENRFHYDDFDGTPGNTAGGNRSKTWQPHQRDYVSADASAYTWNGGKGTELLGVVNYLSGQGANVMSFLTWAAGGDDGAVFPHILKGSLQDYSNTGKAGQWNKLHKDRFDVSKLAQWEKIMEYADKKGVYLHFKTMETENCEKMDSHTFGRERKLYYRELIARFGHHLALNWNLSEETTIKDGVTKATASYIKEIDAYGHHIVIHTYPGEQDQRYTPLLGNNSSLTGASVQTAQNNIHRDVKKWITRSSESGKKWVVANDEQGSANEGIMVSDKQVREKVLWATLMAGGTGVEYYSGYTNDDGDLNGQDHRKRGKKYKEGSYALDFFNTHLQSYLTEMTSSDEVTSDRKDYVFTKAGSIYAVYRPNGGSTGLNLPSGNNKYDVQWFNPRTGGDLTTKNTLGSNLVAPDTNDWVALITSKDDDGNGGSCDNTEVVTSSQDAYLQGNTRFNNGELRVESGKRVSYTQFIVPTITENVTSTKLELFVSADGGNGLIEIFKGSSDNWTEANLSGANKPSEGTKIGSLNTTYSKGQSYQWELSGVTSGETVSLIIKQTGGNDVSFSSKEGTTAPKLILELDCNDARNNNEVVEISGTVEAESFDTQSGIQVESTSGIGGGQNIGYIENGDFVTYNVKVKASGEYELTARVAANTSGGKIIVKAKGAKVGELSVVNTSGWQTWETVTTLIDLEEGEQILRLDFSGGNGFLFNLDKLIFIESDNNGGTGKDCIAVEKNGILAVEAEHFESQSKDGDRKWYTFDETTTGTPTPDPDPNHSNGASGNGYLEILPDTRVTHGDPLTSESFSNKPGKIAIVDYKVKFTSPGKYFVWVRAHSTGSEDNGVHVGIDGTWPSSGQKMQWCTGKREWTWESKQRTGANHCGEPQKIFINVPTAGVHTISFSMREDGFEMDKFVLSKTYTKPTGSGPAEILEDCTTTRMFGTNVEPENIQIKAFPNPVDDLVTISGAEKGDHIIFYNLLGKVVSTKTISGQKEVINLSNIPSGIYLAKILGKGVIKVIKK